MKLKVVFLLAILLLLVAGAKVYGLINFPDTQCSSPHTPNSKPVENPMSAIDIFNQGNYLYDSGRCQEAIKKYDQAITLDPEYSQAYNNRAYTNMRLRNYKEALSDLDKAISLNPNYIQALMNRGDIYNYYFEVDHQKAITDYNKVLSIDRSVANACGHKAMAETNNLLPLAFLNLFMNRFCK